MITKNLFSWISKIMPRRAISALLAGTLLLGLGKRSFGAINGGTYGIISDSLGISVKTSFHRYFHNFSSIFQRIPLFNLAHYY